MEFAALLSFLVLIVGWMALPAGSGRTFEEEAPVGLTQPAGAEA
jgi:hypothetical protein